jgi:hypothetical protein
MIAEQKQDRREFNSQSAAAVNQNPSASGTCPSIQMRSIESMSHPAKIRDLSRFTEKHGAEFFLTGVVDDIHTVQRLPWSDQYFA